MPDISKIKINDATYDIKDKTARESINSLSTDTQNISEGVNDIKSRIGSSSDASVGTSGGVPQTLFAGIKGILEWFTSHWTSARAAKIDNLDAKISTCAKASDWTSTRAGLIDTINTNAAAAKTDAAEAKNNTATNNVASKTGVLSAKLSYIISSLLENTTYGLNALKTAINTIDSNVDTVNTNTASTKTTVSTINTNTTTNNNASKTGILSQKLSYIIASLLENSTYGLNAIKTAVNTINTNTNKTKVICSTTKKVTVCSNISKTSTGSSMSMGYWKSTVEGMVEVVISGQSTSSYNGTIYAAMGNSRAVGDGSNGIMVGSTARYVWPFKKEAGTILTDANSRYGDTVPIKISTNPQNFTVYFYTYVEKNDYLYFYLYDCHPTISSGTVYINYDNG